MTLPEILKQLDSLDLLELTELEIAIEDRLFNDANSIFLDSKNTFLKNAKTKNKENLLEWLKNHPDVWHKNEHGVAHWWWVRNLLVYGLNIFTLEEVEEVIKKV